jgi:hypothetical protein
MGDDNQDDNHDQDGRRDQKMRKTAMKTMKRMPPMTMKKKKWKI